MARHNVPPGEKRNKIIKFFRAPYMVLLSYKFLQIPTVTSHFPVSIKTWLPRQLPRTMAEGVPSVSAASSNSFLAVSTPLESAASSSNVQVVRSRSDMLSKLCFTKLLPVPSQCPQSHITCMSCHFDRRRRNNRLHRTFSKKRVILSCTCNSA